MSASVRPSLILRADANAAVGWGHASRLLSLGREWATAGGRVVFLTASPSPALSALANKTGAQISSVAAAYPDGADIEAVRAEVSAAEATPWVAVDGYGFDTRYLETIRGSGARLLAVDDSPRLRDYPADAFLNQNPGADFQDYGLRPETLPLLGPKWCLLRPEFAKLNDRETATSRTARILISFGGADAGDASSTALRALGLLKIPFEAAVAVGPNNRNEKTIAAAAKGLPVRIERAADMAALMNWADVGLIGGGVTMLEACAAGLPALVLTLADNQEPGAAELAGRNAVRLLGRAADASSEDIAAAASSLLCDRDARAALSRTGRTIADGKGAARVASALRALSTSRHTPATARLRPADLDDALDVWRIANDPVVRANSFQKLPIPLATHMNWYRAQLQDRATRFWLIEAGGVVAGQIRYTKSGDEAEVHYSLRGAFRGKGLGTLALSMSRTIACAELGVRTLKGVVIKPNAASERSFISAGWSPGTEEVRDGRACSVFESICS